jgi:exopolysaccharide production protein ExoQ
MSVAHAFMNTAHAANEAQPSPKKPAWTFEECTGVALLLLFFTHFYIPILEPVQNSLFTAASEDKTVIGQLINVFVWLVAGGLMLRKYRSVLSGFRGVVWTVAFTCFAFLSALWSQDSSVTIRKSVFLLLTTAFGSYFAQRYSVEKQLRMICVAACAVACLSIGFALFLPHYGLDHDAHEGVWTGVFTQKNVCAREMLFLLICLLPYKPEGSNMRWMRRVAILAVLIVTAGTRSKTAFLMAGMMLCFFPALRFMRRLSPGLALVALSSTLLSGLLFFAVALSAAPALVLLIGRDSTMTGRTGIWLAVLDAILKRPLLGYGFAAFWLSLRGESANIVLALRWAVPAAHNGFLEVWLQLGGVGLLLFGLGFFKAARFAIRNHRQSSFQCAAWPLAVLLLTLVYNLDESSLMQPNDFLWVLYIATLVNIAHAADSPVKSSSLARYSGSVSPA